MAKLNLPGMRTVENNAPWLTRILAFGIDIIILNFIILGPLRSLLLRIIPNPTFMGLNAAPDSLLQTLTLIMFYSALIGLFYFVLLEYLIGQTPGKMLFKLKVVSTSDSLTFWPCMVRSLFIFPIFPFVLFWIADPVFAVFHPRKQRLLEVLSRTKTVQEVIV